MVSEPGRPQRSTQIRAWAASSDPEERFHEALLPYASPCPRAPWWARRDPYYEHELFAESPRWTYRRRYSQVLLPNASGRLRKIKTAEPHFLELSERRAASERTKRVIAALIQYHHLTTRQLAALGGWDPHQSPAALAPLWAAGLLQRCVLDPQHVIGQRGDTVWQLLLRAPGQTGRLSTPHNPLLKDWLGGLSHQDWALVTLGVDPFATGAGRRHLRHNLLAAELAVRTNEIVPTVAATWGEPLCSPHLLLPASHPATPAKAPGYKADLGLLREDGFRLVVEITLAGRAERAVGEKMLHWARLLSRYNHNTSGMVVVFLNADPDRHERTALTLRKVHAEYLTAERLGEPGRPALPDAVRSARSHIMLASWREWFPHGWGVSERFRRLSAAFSLDGRTFRYTDLASAAQTPFNPPDPLPWMDALVNFAIAAHHPAWAGGPVLSEAPDPERTLGGALGAFGAPRAS